MFEAKEIMDIAIRLEKNGESVYRQAIEKLENSSLISLLDWMAQEEVKHGNWFTELKKSVESKGNNPFADELNRELFNDLIKDQSFSLKEIDFSKIKDINELLEIFIEFENDTILFYEMIQPFIQDSKTLEQLENIIEEENRHIEKLREFMTKH